MRFQQNLSGYARLSPLSSCPLRSPALALRGSWRLTITALIFWHQFNPAFQSCWHPKIRIQNRSLPRLRLIAHGTFPRRSEQRQG